MKLAEKAEPHLVGAEEAEWLGCLDIEYPDRIQAARQDFCL